MSGYSQLSSPSDQVTASSGNVANATATATLAGAVGKTTYLQGFVISGSGATAGLPVTVTVTGTTNTLHFTYCAAIGVLVANTPLTIDFSGAPLAASATNTSISVSCPALGLGCTNNTVIAYGFQI